MSVMIIMEAVLKYAQTLMEALSVNAMMDMTFLKIVPQTVQVYLRLSINI